MAYREAGRWKPLPFSYAGGGGASDIGMFGDTLYILGSFGGIVLDKDSTVLPNTGVIKYYQDSIWVHDVTVGPGTKGVMSTNGDSLLIWGGSYYDPPTIIYSQFMTTDRGKTWQYPYSIVHPTDTVSDFGATARLEILDNGDILTINNGSPRGNPFSGLSRWDGTQWHAYGNGLFGFSSRVFDFEFYQGELYMGGTFNRYSFPSDPANFIARWTGQEWAEVANGVTGFVEDLFVYDDILYCSINGGDESQHYFGDIHVPWFAGWDGTQWCATPFDFSTPPATLGFIDDTLYATFYIPSSESGDTIGYIGYYDGDFLNGPNAICSTPGLGEIEHPLPSFQLFPNPASDQLRIESGENGIQQLQIVDIHGKSVWEEHLSGPTESHSIDLSQFTSGIYLLKINRIHHRTFVKN